MNLTGLTAYELLKTEELKEIQTTGYILRHKKSGARVVLMECDDENKVFQIGFCTAPLDHTGAAHINEHCVLCGSELFPAKDPFVELAKGSMNTFLNAITFPDKTMYPIASCNDQDFRNLMAVYMDAVFRPNIYKNEKIFRQEGWHYEVSEEGELSINGVVYNEMKGSFSSPDTVIDTETRKLLFPDTPYAFVSGGDPEYIPELSYESFLDFHRKYYHPSNSYIYLYGKMDFEERLSWMDEHYLKNYEETDFSGAKLITLQKPFEAPIDRTVYYSITPEEEEENSAILTWNVCLGVPKDTKENEAMKILDYILISSVGAVLPDVMAEHGIGSEVEGGYDTDLRQAIFSVVARDAEPSQKEEFLSLIRESIQKLVEEGLNKKSLLAAITKAEFRVKEGNYGRYPKGLILGLDMMDTWMYDDLAPFVRMTREPVFAELRKDVEEGTGYFEKLLAEKLLDNPHAVILTALPKVGLTEEREQKVKEKLAAFKATLSEEDLARIAREEKELKEYQQAPTPKEDLEKIPMIHVSDIKKETEQYFIKDRMLTLDDGREIRLLSQEQFTSGILYATARFEVNRIPFEDFGYLSLYQNMIEMVDSPNYSYKDFPDELNIHTGGFTSSLVHTTYQEGQVRTELCYAFKCFCSEIPHALRLMREQMSGLDFANYKRMHDVMLEIKSSMEQAFLSSGERLALDTAQSAFLEEKYRSDLTGRMSFYEFLCDLLNHFEEKKEEIRAKLTEMEANVYFTDSLMVTCSADAEGLAAFEEELKKNLIFLPEHGRPFADLTWKKPEKPQNTAFVSAAQVNFTAQAGNFLQAGFPYHGAMRVLAMILSYDYFWNRVRILGGAYDSAGYLLRDGTACFTSYRDPQVRKTFEIYRSIPDFIGSFETDDRELEKNIIGTISILDQPKNPSAKAGTGFGLYLRGVTEADRQLERDQILSCTQEDIRALKDAVAAVIAQNNISVVGNAGMIREAGDLFDTVRPLLKK